MLERRVIRGQAYTELQWGYGNWNIGLLGPHGQRRVVLVGTTLGRHRTPEGLGVGSTDNQVARRLRGVRQRPCRIYDRTSEWYQRRGSAETVFLARQPPRWLPGMALDVDAVEVRGRPVVGCVLSG